MQDSLDFTLRSGLGGARSGCQSVLGRLAVIYSFWRRFRSPTHSVIISEDFDPGTLTVKLPEFELQDSAADMVISLRIRCCSADRLVCSLSDQYRTGTVKLI